MSKKAKLQVTFEFLYDPTEADKYFANTTGDDQALVIDMLQYDLESFPELLLDKEPGTIKFIEWVDYDDEDPS